MAKLTPASVLTCHWIEGTGLPVALDVKETELPLHTALLAGLDVTEGVVFTVIVALPEAVPVQFASEIEVIV